MQKILRESLTDRTRWPDHALKHLLERIDQELEQRAGSEPPSTDDLAALEQRLKEEANRYQRSSGTVRG